MKKSLIISSIGILVISTALLCNSGSRSYNKTTKLNSIDEIVNVLDTKIISAYDDGYNINYSNDFLECLSKRKRIVDPRMDYNSLDVNIDEERNTESFQKDLLNQYLNSASRLKKYKNPDKIQTVSLKGIGERVYPKDRNGESEILRDDIKLDLVVIDEGEGWVIDYFWITSQPIGTGNDSN